MTNAQIIERLMAFSQEAECHATLTETPNGTIIIQVTPQVMMTNPLDVGEWQTEALALLEAIAEESLGGNEVSLPEKCAMALREMLAPQAVNKLAQYLLA